MPPVPADPQTSDDIVEALRFLQRVYASYYRDAERDLTAADLSRADALFTTALRLNAVTASATANVSVNERLDRVEARAGMLEVCVGMLEVRVSELTELVQVSIHYISRL
jgi:hypothetical protein